MRYLFFLLLLISSAYFIRVREYLELPQTIVLVGDSSLKNNRYVSRGIDTIVSGNVISLARDGATIGTTIRQLDNLPDNINTKSTILVLSVGGNDVLDGSVPVDQLFVSYQMLLRSIVQKMGQSRIVLADMYYPMSLEYRRYYPAIRKWNQLQSTVGHEILSFSTIMDDEDDFIMGIEPSDTGGKKIADAINNLRI